MLTSQNHWQTELRPPTHCISPLQQKTFEKVHVNCARPWTVQIKDSSIRGESKYNIHILTMVDACKNWLELALAPTANTTSCANQFDINGLCCCPCPNKVGHNNGEDFIAEEFQELLMSYDIQSKMTTVKNPMAQALVERLHLTLGNLLCASIYTFKNW